MLYSDKMESVNSAYGTVLEALEDVEGLRAIHYPDKKVCHVEVLDTVREDWSKEAILNIYWEAQSDNVWFTLTNWPNSNVPFTTIKRRLDYNADGMIETGDIVKLSVELFGQLNR